MVHVEGLCWSSGGRGVVLLLWVLGILVLAKAKQKQTQQQQQKPPAEFRGLGFGVSSSSFHCEHYVSQCNLSVLMGRAKNVVSHLSHPQRGKFAPANVQKSPHRRVNSHPLLISCIPHIYAFTLSLSTLWHCALVFYRRHTDRVSEL